MLIKLKCSVSELFPPSILILLRKHRPPSWGIQTAVVHNSFQ